MTNLEILEKLLGYKFTDKNLLLTAITHNSYPNENANHPVPHNERLEFLGDAILGMVAASHLYNNYQLSEGTLTEIRSTVVNERFLASVARKLEIEPFILMSKGQTRKTISGGGKSVLADCFEAIIGAIYLDSGYTACAAFVNTHVLACVPKLIEEGAWLEPKNQLQKIMQQKFRQNPYYQTISSGGERDRRQFEVAVFYRNQELGRGSGGSKKEAEQEAARNAMLKKVYEKIQV